MVYYEKGIPGADALAAQRRLSSYIRFKLEKESSENFGFVQAITSLSIVRSNILLLCIPSYKEAQICQQLEITDGVFISLLELWREYRPRQREQQVRRCLEGITEIGETDTVSAYIRGGKKDVKGYRYGLSTERIRIISKVDKTYIIHTQERKAPGPEHPILGIYPTTTTTQVEGGGGGGGVPELAGGGNSEGV